MIAYSLTDVGALPDIDHIPFFIMKIINTGTFRQSPKDILSQACINGGIAAMDQVRPDA
jgi:hypothetical protein